MSPRLANKVALVTGASSGVGYQAAVALAEAGMRVCVTARRPQPLWALQQRLMERGLHCIAIPADVTRPEQVEQVVNECLRQYGHLDLLVNNAGVQAYAPFEELPWDQVERVLDVNCIGYLRFARQVLPHFRQRKQGHILNVLSMLSLGSAPLLSVYCASKHALLGWSESLQLELKGTGIEVSGLLLPSVSTPMFDHAPTTLSLAPRPLPPVYDTRLAGRWVVELARRPRRRMVPVVLQGKALLWAQRLAPLAGTFLLSRFGARLQFGSQPVLRPEGNLFKPMPQGVGPYGSVPPTPRWKRWGGAALLAALLVAPLWGVRRLLHS